MLRWPSILGRTPGHGGSDNASLAGMWISFETWIMTRITAMPVTVNIFASEHNWSLGHDGLHSSSTIDCIMMDIEPLTYLADKPCAPTRAGPSFSGLLAGQRSMIIPSVAPVGLGMRVIADEGKFNAYYFYRGGSERSGGTSIIRCSQAGPPFCPAVGRPVISGAALESV